MKLKTLSWGLAIASGSVLSACQKGESDLSQQGLADWSDIAPPFFAYSQEDTFNQSPTQA